jgi:dTDP-glucose 4,6-dehydratase
VLTTLRRVKVLVTGGAGFIGSHFVKRLRAAGEDVVVLDKLTYAGNQGVNLEGTDVQLIKDDIANRKAVDGAVSGCDAIVNFAAETHVDRSILGSEGWGRTEFFGTQVLLEVARARGIRLVQVSTDEVYGDIAPDAPPSTEEAPVRPSSPYSVAKAAGDLHVPAYVRTFGVDACITRGANTYGPNQYPEKLVPLFTTNALDNEPLPLYGDGHQRREWLHVHDHCAAVEFVLRQGAAGQIYNIGGEERENLDVVHRILELTGADPGLIRHVEDRAGHDRRYALDDTKLRALGWEPERDFTAGLAETVEWYREHRSWWEPIKSGEFRRYYEQQYAHRFA